MADHVTATATALRALIDEAGGVDRVITPRGWPHLGLVILDAVYSLRADYTSLVQPLLERYCDHAPGISWATASDDTVPEHDARRLLDVITAMSVEERNKVLNRQIGPGTSRRDGQGYPKVDIVADIARILVNRRIVARADFVKASTTDPTLKVSVMAVPGVGIACWKYLLNLSGVEVSKPDTMVMRWLDRVTGAKLTPPDGAELIEAATHKLQRGGMSVTVRQMDHLVWRKESGRQLGRPL